MRFTIIGPVFPYRGGIAHYTARLAHALLAAGDEVEILSFRRQYPRWLYPGKSDREPSSILLDIPVCYLLDPLYPWTWEQGFQRVFSFAPQRVIIAWWTTFWGPAYTYLAWRMGQISLKPIFLIHNTYPHESFFLDRSLARLTLSQGGGYIVQSERERIRLAALLPKAAPVYLCQLPVQDPFDGVRPSKEDARNMLGLASDVPVLLFFGLVRPYKGLRYLLEATALLIRNGITVNLLVAGEFWGNYEDYVRQVSELGLAGKVKMDNRYIPNDEVGRYFAASDLFVAPYIDGTQSASLKLAQGYGLPAVVTSVIADNEDNARQKVAAPSDSASLAKAIQELLFEKSTIRSVVKPDWKPLLNVIHMGIDVSPSED